MYRKQVDTAYTSHIATQVYFTTYEKLKAQMKKREGMPQPIQHMVSAVGAGKQHLQPDVITDPSLLG